MIKNVVFDIGNVLVDFRWRELMKNLNLSKEAQDRFETSVFGSCWWHDLDHGTIDEKDAVIRLREDNIEFREAFDLVWENRDKLVKPYDYAVSWIDSLKEQGYHVYLLSNYPRDIFTLHANVGSFPFLDHVDGKIVSGFVRMIKPDADIYEKLIDTYQLSASECVFIDDREENVQGAINVGMQGIVFKTYEQASNELKQILAECNYSEPCR